MPTLPTIDVTTEQADRIIAAFPGADQTEKAAAYRRWLKRSLRAHVLAVEGAQMDDAHYVDRQARLDAIAAGLPDDTTA